MVSKLQSRRFVSFVVAGCFSLAASSLMAECFGPAANSNADVAAGAALGAKTIGTSAAVPSSITFDTFSVSTRGRMRLTIGYDERITKRDRCRIFVFAVPAQGGVAQDDSTRVARKRAKGVRTRFNARGLPSMASGDNGELPTINLAAELRCRGEDAIRTAPRAKFVLCGKGRKRLSPTKWVRQLKRRL